MCHLHNKLHLSFGFMSQKTVFWEGKAWPWQGLSESCSLFGWAESFQGLSEVETGAAPGLWVAATSSFATLGEVTRASLQLCLVIPPYGDSSVHLGSRPGKANSRCRRILEKKEKQPVSPGPGSSQAVLSREPQKHPSERGPVREATQKQSLIFSPLFLSPTTDNGNTDLPGSQLYVLINGFHDLMNLEGRL